MEQGIRLEILEWLPHSLAICQPPSKIPLRTESWFRAHTQSRAGEFRLSGDRLTSEIRLGGKGWPGLFWRRDYKKDHYPNKTNPNASVAHLYVRHMVQKLNEKDMSRHQHSTIEQGHILLCKYLITLKLLFLINQRPYPKLCVSWALRKMPKQNTKVPSHCSTINLIAVTTCTMDDK